MRFAIAALDRYLGVFEAFVQAGWTPLKLFTTSVQNDLDNHKMVAALAERHQAAIQLNLIGERDLQGLRDQECEALIVACYPWRIPDWRPFLKYAVNFHCSPLPDGRGRYPVHRAILEQRGVWAVTCHRLAPELDKGDIVAAERFPLQPDECHESLDLKIQMAAKRLASRVAWRFDELWREATPQDGGSYWQALTIEDRIIDFRQPVDSIMRHIRAFGRTESLGRLNGRWLVVRRAVGWSEPHSQTPGTVVHVHNRSMVVAAADGYIGLLDADIAGPGIVDRIKPVSSQLP